MDGDADTTTVAGLLRQFLKHYRSRNGRLEYYEGRARVIERHLGDLSLPELNAAAVERFRNERAEEVSATTVRHDLVALGTICRWAVGRGLLERNPAGPETVPRPARPPKNPQPLDAGELNRLLVAAPDWLGLVIQFCVATGVDCGEAIGMTWEKRRGPRNSDSLLRWSPPY